MDGLSLLWTTECNSVRPCIWSEQSGYISGIYNWDSILIRDKLLSQAIRKNEIFALEERQQLALIFFAKFF